jgi:hypothetical protein
LVIGLRIVRIIVWGGRGGTNNGACGDTCRDSAGTIIGASINVRIRSAIDVRAAADRYVAGGSTHGNIAGRTDRGGAARRPPHCRTPGRTHSSAATHRAAHCGTPARADSGAATHWSAHRGASCWSLRYATAHRSSNRAPAARTAKRSAAAAPAINASAAAATATAKCPGFQRQ